MVTWQVVKAVLLCHVLVSPQRPVSNFEVPAFITKLRILCSSTACEDRLRVGRTHSMLKRYSRSRPTNQLALCMWSREYAALVILHAKSSIKVQTPTTISSVSDPATKITQQSQPAKASCWPPEPVSYMPHCRRSLPPHYIW